MTKLSSRASDSPRLAHFTFPFVHIGFARHNSHHLGMYAIQQHRFPMNNCVPECSIIFVPSFLRVCARTITGWVNIFLNPTTCCSCRRRRRINPSARSSSGEYFSQSTYVYYLTVALHRSCSDTCMRQKAWELKHSIQCTCGSGKL